MAEHKWYVVHTYSGYENRVELTLWERIRQNKMEEQFSEVLVPKETPPENKSERRGPPRKFFPGYVFVKMELNTHTWHLVNDTPRVTGFVGGGKKPGVVRPVPEREVLRITNQIAEGTASPTPTQRFEAGETVNVIDGAFNGFTGTVDEVDVKKARLRVLVSIFGRATPIDLDFSQVKKV